MKDPAPSKTKGKSKKVEVEMPSTWQKYANAVLIPVIIGLLVYLLVRYRINANAAERLGEQYKLTAARSRIYTLQNLDFGMMSQEQVARERDSRYREIDSLITELLAGAKDPAMRAEALIAKGDLNWGIAQFPDLPGATTNPSLKPAKAKDQMLSLAESAYNEVIGSYADQSLAFYTAKLGLASIAQNRLKFDDAEKLLTAVENDQNAPEAFRRQATVQRELNKTIRTPIYFPPTTAPALEAATTQPTTQPAAQASATTQPTTKPK